MSALTCEIVVGTPGRMIGMLRGYSTGTPEVPRGTPAYCQYPASTLAGCEIVVCTPGRMIDMLCANNGRVTNMRSASLGVPLRVPLGAALRVPLEYPCEYP